MGKKSSAGASDCVDCNPPNTYQDKAGQSTCKTCTVRNCAVGSTEQKCTQYIDSSCTSCKPIINCIFNGASGCEVNGLPTCNCIEGFEMTRISQTDYKCVECGQGKYKDYNGRGNCTKWSDLPCRNDQYAALGTRKTSGLCLDYPNAPFNAYNDYSAVQTWTCNRGFEKLP
jgi:hypothetical protein